MLQAIDDFLIDCVYQKISDWVYSWLGVNNFALARFCCYIAAVVLLIDDVLSQRMSITNVMIMGMMFINWVFTFVHEKNASIQMKSNTRNDLRLTQKYVRFALSMLYMSFFLLQVLGLFLLSLEDFFQLLLFDNIYQVSFCSIFYFSACDPRPPGRAKIKDLIERFHQSYNLASHPT